MLSVVDFTELKTRSLFELNQLTACIHRNTHILYICMGCISRRAGDSVRWGHIDVSNKLKEFTPSNSIKEYRHSLDLGYSERTLAIIFLDRDLRYGKENRARREARKRLHV